MKFWDKEKNTDDPAGISSAERNQQYHWKCQVCGYEWEATPRARLKGSNLCPCHDTNKAIWPGVNDVLTLVPGMKREYDPALNPELNIGFEGINSDKQATWKCPDCKKTWTTSIRARIKKGPDGKPVFSPCTHYNTVWRKKEDVPKVSEVPDIVKFWDYDKNPLPPDKVASNSTEYANWKCPTCDYEWTAVIKERNRRDPDKCPACSGRVVAEGINDLFTIVPEAKAYFDFEKNRKEGIDCSAVGVRSRTKYYWKCPDCKKTSFESVTNRIRGNAESGYTFVQCKDCHPEQDSRYTPATSDPYIIKYWDFEKNAGIDINKISVSDTRKVCWRCKKCGYSWKATIIERHRHHECPCCGSGRALSEGYNDALTLMPELSEIFVQAENPGVDLKKIGINSLKTINFHCKKCGYQWSSQMKSRRRINPDGTLQFWGCPVCNGKRVVSGISSLDKTNPDLILMWSDENEDRMENVSAKSVAYEKWVCPDCKNTFPARIIDMASGTVSCPFCDGRKAKAGMNTLADLNPDIARFWAKENEDKPTDVLPSSDRYRKWLCPDCENVYAAPIRDMVAGKAECPYCAGKRVLAGMNSLADLCPDAAKMWSSENEDSPSDYMPSSSVLKKWSCPTCGGTFWARIHDVVEGDYTCPYCERNRVLPGYNSLADEHPEIAALWSPENDTLPVNHFSDSLVLRKWICSECGGVYTDTIRAVVAGEKNCPYCAGKMPLKGFNSLGDKFPELAKMWADDEISPYDYLPDSAASVHWNCLDCGGIYTASIRDEVAGTAECPYCTGRKPLKGFNTFGDKYPELAKMWADSNSDTPYDYLPKSSLYKKWTCPTCGGTFGVRIKDMVSGETGCPYCSGKKVLPGFNSFKVKHPDLMTEWDTIANYLLADPDEVGDRSQQKVWWVCQNNPDHRYPMSIASRLMFQKRQREACPYCKGRRVKQRYNV